LTIIEKTMPIQNFAVQLVDDEPIAFYQKYIEIERMWNTLKHNYTNYRRLVTIEITNTLLDFYGLTGWRCVVNKRLTSSLGQCCYSRRIIQIGYNYLMYEDTDFKEVLNTIKHEIAHALCPKQKHNNVWKECAKRIGSDGETLSEYTEWCKKY
jgi:hypothetical protein